MADDKMKLVSLYSTEGGSDKVYTMWIEPQGDGFLVQAQWGRRGGPMQAGTKTPKPVGLVDAEKVYQKVLKEKQGKGYHEGETAPAFSQVTNAVDTGLRPMLLTDCTSEGPKRFLEDPAWGAQEKMNGKRIMLDIFPDGRVVGINRRGLECPIPQEVTDAFKAKRGGRGGSARPIPRLTLDGELVGTTYHAFDLLLEADDIGKQIDRKSNPVNVRHYRLTTVLRLFLCESVKTVDLMVSTANKGLLVTRLQTERREGVVFKRLDAPYEPGRRENVAKAIAVKVKFYATISAIVMWWTDKSSVEVGLKDGPSVMSVGKVTIHAKHVDKISMGNIIRLKYLYATSAKQLYQANLDPTADGKVIADQLVPDPIADLKFEGKGEEE